MTYDLIVVGSGAAGMIAAIRAAREHKKVLLLEKLGQLGAKLKATGGGRCNLTNTLPNDLFMERFGRHGRFMTPALEAFDHTKLRAFFDEIGVATHAPDGFRVFPVTHNAATIVSAMKSELEKLGVVIQTHARVLSLCIQNQALNDGGQALNVRGQALNGEQAVCGVLTAQEQYHAPHVIIATGGLGYPTLGAEGDGYTLAVQAGHTTTQLFPAMMPLAVKESWVARCTADTIPKATLRVNLPKTKKLKATGDLIFTKQGIRGPVVLDFSRELTPLLETYGEVPLLANLTGGMNEDALLHAFKSALQKTPTLDTLGVVQTLLPLSLSEVLCELSGCVPHIAFSKQEGSARAALLSLLAWTPLTVTGHDGFKMAMITRGGVTLKEIDPETMQSRLVRGLYFCGEVIDLDGPCGGYNLQWSFASGYLAGALAP